MTIWWIGVDYERGTVGVLAREESASCVVVAGGIASRDVRVGGGWEGGTRHQGR